MHYKGGAVALELSEVTGKARHHHGIFPDFRVTGPVK
jgi:hypothetical protein